jgi:hypothetical protein
MKTRAASASLAASVALSLTLILATASVAAGPTRLNQGTVSPTTGTTATVFAYSVHYVGHTNPDETAISVTAVASDGSTTRTTSLSRTSGSTLDGIWEGSTTLPAGSWTMTFHAVGSLGTTPSSTRVFVLVTGTTPTPVPPPPTPRPTPRPTAVPATTTPVPGASLTPGPTPFGTTITNPSGTPVDSAAAASGKASPSASASPAAIESPGGRPFNVPIEGVVAIGLLGAVTVAAALGERRRRQAVAAFKAGQATTDDPYAQAAEAEDLQDGSSVADDETVAMIDYEGLDEGPDEPR